MATKSKLASEIEAGAMLHGLDKGYVFETDDADVTDISIRTGNDYPYVVPEDYRLITFHTAQGEEAYLICPKDMPITVW
jgi:hypothetical protein